MNNKLVKYEERTVEQGFTFHNGWWGEFSPTGELVMVYAYPFTQINNWDWGYKWSTCRIFYPFDGSFVGDILHIDDVPDEVAWHFWDVAEEDMLAKKEEIEKWAEWEEEDDE